MGNKILLGVFIFLFFVVIGEVGYYVFYLNQSKANNYPTPSLTQPPYSVYSISFPAPYPPQEPIEVIRKMVNNRVEMIQDNLITSIKDIVRYEGRVVDIDIKGSSQSPNDQLSYKTKLTLQGKTRNFNILFNEFDLNKTKVFKKLENQEIPISLDDLKVGDRVIIDATLDLTLDWGKNAVEIKILKI